MKIVLINVSGRMASDGSRLIAALLKREGHEVKTVFMARPEPLEYEMEELNALAGLLADVDLVLVAVYSSYALRAVQVTEFIHKKFPGLRVIWGGPHCISVPEICLQYADGVCFSEGDEAIVDLVNRMEQGIDYFDTPNMAFKVNGSYKVNKVLPPFSDLDSLPYYDYALEDHYLLDRDLIPMDKKILKERLAGYPYYIPILYVVTSRGCPHSCSYCNNCRYLKMFGVNSIRFQSVDRVIQELEYVLGQLDFISFIGIGDDDFFIRPKDDLIYFAEEYKRRIRLPFGVAMSANSFHEEKMRILLHAGLRAVQVGVQSGSQRVLTEVYSRTVKVSKVKRVIDEIEQYHHSHDLDFFVDFIIDNPYETRDDIYETFAFIRDLPGFVNINIFFLAFFPGTPIYERALEDGFIEPFDERAFRFYTRTHIQYQKNFETFLILLSHFLRRHPWLNRFFPKILWRILGSKIIRKAASALPGSLYSSLGKTTQKKYVYGVSS
ncbi:MAG: B12-binding domain-containing radical SAM protein [Deltaproteobacteria bacterium]|nr:B12-binding domain-containing radical SAM protein [Deltaproteobacteria bacterium]